ncbi:MAG: homoserine kinase [Christensenellaceae bacterium]
MYNVRVCASSANLGCGFDVLSLALSINNEYAFELSQSYSLKGFEPKYLNVENNLVLTSFKKTFEYADEQPPKVEITELSCEIPKAGGLGRSAACVVAGVLGANSFLKNKLTESQILAVSAEIEGHPDNVAATLFGGLCATFKTKNGYKTEKYSVSDKLKFMIAYPDYSISTYKARMVLPDTVSRRDAVDNMSKIVNLPRAFENGDIELLKEISRDNIHEPYRFRLITDGSRIKNFAERNGFVAVISGSGATMLLISDDERKFEAMKNQKFERKWTFKSVLPCNA